MKTPHEAGGRGELTLFRRGRVEVLGGRDAADDPEVVLPAEVGGGQGIAELELVDPEELLLDEAVAAARKVPAAVDMQVVDLRAAARCDTDEPAGDPPPRPGPQDDGAVLDRPAYRRLDPGNPPRGVDQAFGRRIDQHGGVGEAVLGVEALVALDQVDAALGEHHEQADADRHQQDQRQRGRTQRHRVAPDLDPEQRHARHSSNSLGCRTVSLVRTSVTCPECSRTMRSPTAA